MLTNSPTMNDQLICDWAIDVTCYRGSGVVAFVPICGDEIAWGVTMIQDRAPGQLVGVVSQNGIEEAIAWAEDNPYWQIEYSRLEDISQ